MKEVYAYRDRPENKRVIADFYWRTLLCSAFVIVFFAAVYGISLLYSTLGSSANTDTATASAVQPIPMLDKTRLQNTLDEISIREQNFEYLKTQAPDAADPSR